VITAVLQAAELGIHSRERIDDVGPKSACQSARFQTINGLERFQPREVKKHSSCGSQFEPLALRQHFEQLRQAWTWNGLARFGPTTPKRIEPNLLRSIRPTRATTSLAASVDPTEAG
jgi:hypothetical protein